MNIRNLLEGGSISKEEPEHIFYGLKDLFKQKPFKTGTSQSDSGSTTSELSTTPAQTDEPIQIGDTLDEALDATNDPSQFTWVQCENVNCLKWRKITAQEASMLHDDPWYCSMNSDLQHSSCVDEEESSEEWEQQLDNQGMSYAVTTNPQPVQTRGGRVVNRPVRFQD